VLDRIDHSYVNSEFGRQWMAILRHRLHQGIIDCVSNTPNGKTPIRIHLDNAVTSIDVAEGTFVSARQGLVKKDVVIVADGCYVSFIPAGV
jgi:2-polyprenyl-6-methoxyphenol hydroxylase-like FAD-dependent oxidoreductase